MLPARIPAQRQRRQRTTASTTPVRRVSHMELGIRETLQDAATAHHVVISPDQVNDLARDLATAFVHLPYTRRWRTRSPHGDFKLTVRERQVLLGVARGLTTDQIGARLQISRDTVKTHLRRAYEALGVHRGSHAVAVAIKHGILTLDEIDNP